MYLVKVVYHRRTDPPVFREFFTQKAMDDFLEGQKRSQSVAQLGIYRFVERVFRKTEWGTSNEPIPGEADAGQDSEEEARTTLERLKGDRKSPLIEPPRGSFSNHLQSGS